MRLINQFVMAGAVAALVCGPACARDRYAGPTGTIPPAGIAAPAGGPDWSGESGSSGDPRMTAAAIRAAAANFHGCLERLWPLAARRGISRNVYVALTAPLTPDLRIMDLLDAQPEFTKSFWDYLDLLVNDARIEQGRALLARYARPSTRSSAPTASTAISSPRSGAWRPITARRSATVR